MSALLDPGDGNDWAEDDYIAITDDYRAACTHPESARTYRDITDRDHKGRLLGSIRIITCQRDGVVLEHTTKTWQPKETP